MEEDAGDASVPTPHPRPPPPLPASFPFSVGNIRWGQDSAHINLHCVRIIASSSAVCQQTCYNETSAQVFQVHFRCERYDCREATKHILAPAVSKQWSHLPRYLIEWSMYHDRHQPSEA